MKESSNIADLPEVDEVAIDGAFRRPLTRSDRQGKIMRPTLSEDAYNYVVYCVNRGLLAPGQRITESELAEKLGMSHVPVREAMTKLQYSGWIERSPRKGASIRKFGAKELKDLYHLRMILELGALDTVVDTMSKNQLAELEKLVVTLEESFENNVQVYEETNKRFHWLIVLFSGNERLIEIYESVLIQACCFLYYRNSGDQKRCLHNHRAIVQALAAKDYEDARKAVKHDIEGGLEQAMTLRLKHSNETNANSESNTENNVSE